MVAFSGCKDVPQTSSGVLDDLQKELKTPIRYAPEINADPCLYSTLAHLWREYDYLSRDEQAAFRSRLIDKVDALEVQPSRRIVRYVGRANFLYCQIGHYAPPEGSHDESFVTTRLCGAREVDANYEVEGENRRPGVVVGKGKRRSLTVEYADFQGEFHTYVVRNLHREFKDFSSVQDAVFVKYLNHPEGELFNPDQGYIRQRRSISGARCADDGSLSLEDLVRE